MGELKRHFRDKVWAIRVPRSIHDNVGRIERATEEMELELRRSPSVTELAQWLDLQPSEILEALEAQHNRRSLPISRPITDDEAGTSGEERIGTEDPAYDLVEGRMTGEAILPGLERREREVLKMRFVDELPQTKIAERLGKRRKGRRRPGKTRARPADRSEEPRRPTLEVLDLPALLLRPGP